MSYSFTSVGKPKTKQRPRLGKRGRVFTPAATLEAQDVIAGDYDGPLFEGPISVEIAYESFQQTVVIHDLDWEVSWGPRGDIDNYVKLTLDALNGVAWADDKQVKGIHAYYL